MEGKKKEKKEKRKKKKEKRIKKKEKRERRAGQSDHFMCTDVGLMRARMGVPLLYVRYLSGEVASAM